MQNAQDHDRRLDEMESRIEESRKHEQAAEPGSVARMMAQAITGQAISEYHAEFADYEKARSEADEGPYSPTDDDRRQLTDMRREIDDAWEFVAEQEPGTPSHLMSEVLVDAAEDKREAEMTRVFRDI